MTKLTPSEEERLALLVEECSEVIQIACKILRHGYESTHPKGGPNNRALLEQELGDLDWVIKLMVENDDVNAAAIQWNSRDKGRRVQEYLHYNYD